MATKEDKIFQDFYRFCLTSCSEKRLRKVEGVLKYAKKTLKKDLTKLNVDDVVKYLAELNQSNFSAWTKNDYKKIFKRFLKWHYKDLEMVEGDKVKLGFKGVNFKKAFNKERINKNTLIKPEELEKLIRTAKSLKWKAIISFLYESAFRPCEMRMLKWKHLKFDDSSNLCRVWTLSPKTKESREVPVRDCIVHLKRWKAEYQFPDRTEEDFVFPSQHYKDKPMGDAVVTQMLKRICETARIRPIFPYMLRHSRIYEIQKNTGTRISSKFAGHSIKTSEIYDHLDSDDVEESLLKTVYVTEELPEEKKHELEKRLADVEKFMKEQGQQIIKLVNEREKIISQLKQELNITKPIEIKVN